jgi:hypothetical protein
LKIVLLSIFIIFSLIGLSSSFALPADQSAQKLVKAKTLKCTFFLSVGANWDNDIPNHEVSDSEFDFFFSAIDLEKKKATIIGNAGSEEVSVIANGKGTTFFELTPTGNRNFTTVFPYFSETLSGFAAVHSRHINLLGAPIPSQWHGICKVWD